jgi:hypothetical protein
LQEEEEELTVDIDDSVLYSWYEGWHLHQFVDYVDVLEYCPLALEVLDHLPDQADHSLLKPAEGEAQQLLHELPWLQDLDVAEVVLDVVHQFFGIRHTVHYKLKLIISQYSNGCLFGIQQ